MIPHKLHLYWDRSPMSLLQTFTVISFHKYNPDWEINLYLFDHREVANTKYVPDYIGTDYFGILEELDYVKMIDIDLDALGVARDMCGILVTDNLRRCALYEKGGVYCDFDVLWLKPMSMFGDDFECTVSFRNYTSGYHSVGVTIAEQGSPYLKSLIDEYPKIKYPYAHQAFGADIDNKKYPNYDTIKAMFPRVRPVKYNVFYPYELYDLKRLYVQDDPTPIYDVENLCLHWFNGHDMSKKYVNSGEFKPCSMTSILKMEGHLSCGGVFFV